MVRKPVLQRVVSLCIALTFLPVLLSLCTVWEPDGLPMQETSAPAQVTRLAELLCDREFLPLRSVYIDRVRPGRGQHTPRYIPFDCRNTIQYVPAVQVPGTVMLLSGDVLLCSQRFIIRYIHDQDGRKGLTSEMLQAETIGGKNYENTDHSGIKHCDASGVICHRLAK